MARVAFYASLRVLRAGDLHDASHVTRHTSHVTRHTSHVTRHTSHVTRHTSHVTLHNSQGRFDWDRALAFLKSDTTLSVTHKLKNENQKAGAGGGQSAMIAVPLETQP